MHNLSKEMKDKYTLAETTRLLVVFIMHCSTNTKHGEKNTHQPLVQLPVNANIESVKCQQQLNTIRQWIWSKQSAVSSN